MRLLAWVVKRRLAIAQALGTLLLMGLILRLWPLLLVGAVLLGLITLAVRGPHALTRRRQ